MINNPHVNNNFPPEFSGWAVKMYAAEKEYIEHRAQFAPEPVRSIAKLILAVADPGRANKSYK